MSLTFRAATEAGTGSAAANLSINVPAGVVDGDFLLLFGVTADGDDGGFDALTGWTEILDAAVFLTGGAAPSPPGMSVWHRIASSEPASYIITPTFGTTGICAQMLAFIDVDPVTPIDLTSITAIGDGANADPGSITTVTDEAMVVVASFIDSVDITTQTVPSGYTDPDGLGRVVGAGGGNGCTLGTAYRSTLVSPAGAEDPAAFTTGAEQWGAPTIALRPAAPIEQEGFRWRNDDGSESTATWKQNQDVDHTGQAKEENVRLRILSDATGNPPTQQVTLQVKRDDEAATEWRDV